jgi:uncharacterized protein (DUF1501 family)
MNDRNMTDRNMTDRAHDHAEAGISRRRFLTGLGVAGTAAVAAGYGLSVWRDGGSPAPGSATATVPTVPRLGGGHADRTLVVVELGGGNDGLNTVVPMVDPTYRTLRPTLGVTDAIALDDTIGLHPGLAKLAARYRAGQVAIVEGLGYPDPNLSHFASLGYWWSGVPGQSGNAGWLGRYLDGTVGYDDPLAAVGLGPIPSPALLGNRSFATTIADATGLQPSLPAWIDTPDDLVAAWARFVPASPDPTTLMGGVQQAIELTVRARHELARTLHDDGSLAATADTPASYGKEETAAVSLALAAQLVIADGAPRVIYINGLGDYDTHQGEAQRHPVLMQDLDAGLDAFFTALDGAGASDRAIVMTVSEFGRRPAENGSGTDHGTAAPQFVIGAKVKGGRYGAPPSLTQLDDQGNLVHTTDFRSLYATALQDWLGVEAEPVVGRGFAPLPGVLA